MAKAAEASAFISGLAILLFVSALGLLTALLSTDAPRAALFLDVNQQITATSTEVRVA